MKVTVKYNDPFFKNTGRAFKAAMLNSAKRISLVSEDAAKEDYAKKRKTRRTPSFIFNSFYYDIQIGRASCRERV